MTCCLKTLLRNVPVQKVMSAHGTMVSAIPSIVAKCKKALEEDTIHADVNFHQILCTG